MLSIGSLHCAGSSVGSSSSGSQGSMIDLPLDENMSLDENLLLENDE